MKNNLKVRLYYPGETGFEFYCASVFTSNYGDTKNMMVNFDWEIPNDKGDYDREAGAPNAVKSFLFQLEINKKDYERSYGLDARKIDFVQYSSNGVMLKDIGNFQMNVESI